MEKIIRFIKKYFGETLVIVGSGLFIYNILNFSYEGKREGGLDLDLDLKSELVSGVAYYYTQDTILIITFGIILMLIGIFIIRNKNN